MRLIIGIRVVLVAILVYIFSACSAQWHIKKAVKKDPTIEKSILDTLTLTKMVVDTVYNSDSTYYIEHRIVEYDSIFHYTKYDFSEMKNWFQHWQEQKTTRTEIRHESKVDRTVIRQENKTERNKAKQDRKAKRSNWWIWLLVGLFLGLAGFLLVSKYFPQK